MRILSSSALWSFNYIWRIISCLDACFGSGYKIFAFLLSWLLVVCRLLEAGEVIGAPTRKITGYLPTELIFLAEKPRTKLTEIKKRCFPESIQSNEIICQSTAEFSRVSRELHQQSGGGKLTLACQSCAALCD